MYFALLLYVSYNFRVILCYWMFNTFLCLLILYTWDTMFGISESDSDINDMVCRNLKKMMFLSVLNIIMWRQNDRFFPVSDSVRWYWQYHSLRLVLLVYGVYGHFQQYFSYIVAVCINGGGNRSTWRNPHTCASHWPTLSHNVVSSTSRHERGSNPQF